MCNGKAKDKENGNSKTRYLRVDNIPKATTMSFLSLKESLPVSQSIWNAIHEEVYKVICLEFRGTFYMICTNILTKEMRKLRLMVVMWPYYNQGN